MKKSITRKSNYVISVRAGLILSATLALAGWISFQTTTSARVPRTTFVVTTAAADENDVCDASCSLREAIIAANNSAGADTIEFDISVVPFVIAPTSALPNITDAVTIDGTTQSGFSGTPLIEINGANAGSSANGLRVTGNEVVIKSLIINGFSRAGIEIAFASHNTIAGCYIGTNAAGNLAAPNKTGIVISTGGNNIIGGAATTARNVISGNDEDGVYLNSGSFVANNQVKGNFIGTAADGVTALPNGGDGIESEAGFDGSSNPTFIGGTRAGEANVIAFNGGKGINVEQGDGVRIRANSIFSNSELGIDLENNGVTLNDDCDADTGSVNLTLQNFPTISNVTSAGGTTTIDGTLNSKANQTFTLDFFSSSQNDPTGFGEGKTYLGSTTVSTKGLCTTSFSAAFAATLTSGETISATATDASGNTSEFSRVFIFGAVPADLSVTKNDSADPVQVLSSFDYIITVSNNAADAAALSATLSDTVPETLSINSITTTVGSCQTSSNDVSCLFGDLAAGASATVIINVFANLPGTLSNTATVGALNQDSNPANNSDTETTVVQGADLTIEKTDSADPAIVGANFTYNLQVSNIGQLTAENIFVIDNLPDGVTFVSASAGCSNSGNSVQCELVSLAVNSSTNFSIVVAPNAVGNLSNSASVQTSTPESDNGNNFDTKTTAVSAGLTATLTDAPDPVLQGQNITYTATVTNNFNQPTIDLTLMDVLPASVSFVSASAGCSLSGNTVTCVIGSLASGASASVSIAVTTNQGGATANSISATATNFNTATATATTTVIPTVPNTQNFVFTTATNESLTDMTNAAQLVGSSQTNAASAVQPIGFDFLFMGNPTPARYAQFSVNSNGVLRLGATQISGSLNAPLGQNSQIPAIAPYGAAQKTSATGSVRSKITGTAPNRVLVVQWRNMTSTPSVSDTAPNLTYEARLYETTGAIEFVYGSMTQAVFSNFPQIGFTSENSVGAIGAVTAAQSGTPAPSYDGLTAAPAGNNYSDGEITVLSSSASGSRRVFRFTPPIPNQPTGVTFSNVAATSLIANWTDNAANENGYAIYASSDGGATFGFAAVAGQNATSANVSNLEANTNYVFRVFAVSESGLSQSAQNSQMTLASGSFVSTLVGGDWSNPSTWTNNQVPTAADSVTISGGATVTIDAATNAAYDIQIDGTLEFSGAQSTSLNAHSATVSNTGIFRSAATGTQIHELNLAGNLTNNGTLDFSTNTNMSGVNINFVGATDATFGGAGATTNVRQIALNSVGFGGSGRTIELNPASFTVRGSATESASGFLILTNGTLKISGTFTGTHRTFISGSPQIPQNTGIWLNNPNFSVLYNVTAVTNNGAVRVSNGTMTLGTTATVSLFGGSLTVGGGLLETTGIVTPIDFTQTGGTLVIGKLFCSATIFSAVGTFTTSGGAIILQGASACGSSNLAFNNTGAALNITGGTLQTGGAASGGLKVFSATGRAFNFTTNGTSAAHITSATGFVVLGTTTVGANTALNATDFNAFGNTTINSGSTLTALRFRQTGATFTNNGILRVSADASVPPVSSFSFSGIVPQSYTGGGTAGTTGTPLSGFDISNTGGGVTIDPASPTIITSRVNLFTGTFVNSNKIQLGTGGASSVIIQRGNASTQTTPPGEFDVAPAFNFGTGGLQLLYSNAGTNITTALEVPASRTVRRISVSCPLGVALSGGDLIISNASPAGSLDFASGIFDAGANTLIVGATTTVTRTSGYVSGNLRMDYSATGNKIFHTGTANGYSPVTVNAQAGGTFPSNLTVKTVQGTHPNAPNQLSALKRYWQLTEGGSLNAVLTFQYADADLPIVPESSLELKRYTGTAFDTIPATLDTTANTITTAGGITNFSDWTLLSPLSPTAASVSVSGRVLSAWKRGIAGARISMTDANGNVRIVQTNSFGYYRFGDVPAGATYIFDVSHKRYRFLHSSAVLFVGEDLNNFTFTALP